MKTLFIVAIVALISSSFDDPEGRASSITFHPKEGLELSKSFRMTYEVELDEMTLSVGGEEVSMDGTEMSMTLELEESVSVSDTYVAMGDGRPEKLRRTFDELAHSQKSSGTQVLTTDEEYKSDLEGETVLFVWDEDEEECVASFEDSEADEDLLEELEEDMDLRGFLPEGEVEEGDSWELEASEMERLLSLGGDLHFETGDEEEGEEADDLNRAWDDALENLEGTITCTYSGDSEVDSRMVAAITIEAEFYGSADADALTVTMTFDLEGQLDWDLEGGHFVAFELGGEFDVDVEMTDGEALMTMSLDGEISFTGEAEEE